MDFDLSEDQRAYRDLAHRFAEQEIVPVAESYDQTGDYPWPILRKAFEVGLMYVNVPERYGGAALDKKGVLGTTYCLSAVALDSDHFLSFRPALSNNRHAVPCRRLLQ